MKLHITYTIILRMFQLFRKSQSVHGSASQGDLYQKMHFAGSNLSADWNASTKFRHIAPRSRQRRVYHQSRRNCISSKRSFVYHHCEKKCSLRLMIYTFGDEMHAYACWYTTAFAMDKKSTGRNLSIFGGGEGIRTLATLSCPTRFRVTPLRPAWVLLRIAPSLYQR